MSHSMILFFVKVLRISKTVSSENSNIQLVGGRIKLAFVKLTIKERTEFQQMSAYSLLKGISVAH